MYNTLDRRVVPETEQPLPFRIARVPTAQRCRFLVRIQDVIFSVIEDARRSVFLFRQRTRSGVVDEATLKKYNAKAC